MFKRVIFTLAIAVAGLPVLTRAEVCGAGSTAAAPVYRVQSAGYVASSGITLSYNAMGSEEGLKRVRTGVVDFGAPNVPFSSTDTVKAGLVCIPSVATGAVPFVDLPGVPRGQLKLTDELLAQIFLGEVGSWGVPGLRVLNPGVTLSELRIHPVVRTDGLGTMYHFTDYPSAVNVD